MSLLKKIQDKYGVIHEIGDSRVDAFETELTGGEHNVPYSPAVLSKTNAIEQKIDDHISNLANPHKVTKEQLGLANVENKSSSQIRSEITKENVTNALGYTPVDESKVGAANGVASLDSSGKIPASQIPGGFDNIEEYDTITAFPATGVEGKIYVTKDTNLTYRWTGSQYTEISASLALGETSKTAYRGDRGKIAYEHSQITGNTSIHHTHSNKALLDSYKQTEADLANAVAKVHEHGNKTVLDGITANKVTSWDGKADAFDILPTTKGGTGTNASSQEQLMNTLINTLTVDSNTSKDNDYYVGQVAGGGTTNTTYKRHTLLSLWNYIKGKISSVLGLTASNYSGKAATAGTADKAVADNSGNNIVNTYATKSELSTHTSDTTVHITAAERTAWNAKQNALKAGSGITISNSTISALNRLIPVDISTNETKDFDNLPSDGILYYKNSSTDFSNQPEKTALRFIQWSSSIYYSLQLAISNTKKIYIRTSDANSNKDGKVWDDWIQFANIDELNKVNSSLTTHTNDTTIHITAAERTAWNAKASTSVATTSANGLMSKTDKSKLDGISSGANKADVSYASKKLTKTINGTTTDVVAASTIISDTNTFGNFAAVTDVNIDGTIYHTYWKVAPTSSNQVYGFAAHPTNGKLYRVYNNKGTYSVYGYDTDTNTTYSFDGTYNSSTNKAATVSSVTTRIATAKEELTAAIDTVNAKGIVINEINGENVICFE